jgi:hypothetical protein
MPKNAEQIQTFLKEARDQVSDVLTLDSTTAWEKLCSNQLLPYGLRAHWQREQVTQAVPRALKAAVVLPIALETDVDRTHLINRLLVFADEVTDRTLITWLRSTTSAERRALLAQVELLFPQINIAGYRAIAAEAARIGWPKFYKEDLAIDLNVLCSVGAPKEFWWGVRSTGTDLFQPNTLASLEWALAREKHGSAEQLHYHYTGHTLRPIALHLLIVQLAHSLKANDYEQRWHDAVAATPHAGEVRSRTYQEQIAYQQASQEARRAEEAYRRVVSLKQRYHS